jgi:hypothetical protein
MWMSAACEEQQVRPLLVDQVVPHRSRSKLGRKGNQALANPSDDLLMSSSWSSTISVTVVSGRLNNVRRRRQSVPRGVGS